MRLRRLSSWSSVMREAYPSFRLLPTSAKNESGCQGDTANSRRPDWLEGLANLFRTGVRGRNSIRFAAEERFLGGFLDIARPHLIMAFRSHPREFACFST